MFTFLDDTRVTLALTFTLSGTPVSSHAELLTALRALRLRCGWKPVA